MLMAEVRNFKATTLNQFNFRGRLSISLEAVWCGSKSKICLVMMKVSYQLLNMLFPYMVIVLPFSQDQYPSYITQSITILLWQKKSRAIWHLIFIFEELQSTMNRQRGLMLCLGQLQLYKFFGGGAGYYKLRKSQS